MRIDFGGKLVAEKQIRAGSIGCGSHSFRNVYPTFQFAPVELVATCDLDGAKAQAFARQFGAERAYDDHRRMLDSEDLDAVFIVTGYDQAGRPLYPGLAVDCLRAGCHVWMEKPPAASCAELEKVAEAAEQSGKHVLVGMKKMFAPANEKAKELMAGEEFGRPALVMLQYPQYVPSAEEFRAYIERASPSAAMGFLDHICHPASLMVFLAGIPRSLYYERASDGSAVAVFGFESGVVGSIALTRGASLNCGMERTTIVSDSGRHITVENNLRVTYHRLPGLSYGDTPSFYAGSPAEAAAVWEPEFSLGQFYNKGLFLLGYFGEVNEFARARLEGRPPRKGTLDQAWQVTRIFEAFAEGPRNTIMLPQLSP